MDDSAISLEPIAADTAPPDAAETTTAPRGLRLWFAIFVVWMTALAIAAVVLFARYDAGDASALGPWILVLMAFFLSLCNVLVPLPTAWIILLAASDSVGLFESHWLRVLTVASVGATGTMMANLNEYHLLGYFLRDSLGRRIRQSRPYLWAVRWFNLAPFQALTVIAFVPVPIDFVRWLAILRNYSRTRYALAYWIGRMPRYALLAGIAVVLQLGWLEILLLQLALIVVLGARFAWTTWRRRANSEPEEKRRRPPKPANIQLDASRGGRDPR